MQFRLSVADSETKEKKQKLATAGGVDSKTHSMDTVRAAEFKDVLRLRMTYLGHPVL